MNHIEEEFVLVVSIVTTVVAWTSVALTVLLLGAVLFLYREVDRLYGRAINPHDAPLAVGAPAPDLEVLRPDGSVDSISFSSIGALIVVFVAAGCSRCDALLKRLDRADRTLLEQLLVVDAGTSATTSVSVNHSYEVCSLSNPVAFARDWRLPSTPYVYVLRGGRVEASASPDTVRELRELLGAGDLPRAAVEEPV